MTLPGPSALDRAMMTQTIALARQSGAAGEYPYAAIVCRNGVVVAQSENRVKRDGDVTRHAEVAAISAAQKALGTVSLDDCTLYANAEPCAFCSYAIRESRIRRVVYALSSPHMGGVSKWPVLTDGDLSRAIPEVFAPPPEIVAGFMAEEAEQALKEWNAIATFILEKRGLLDATRRTSLAMPVTTTDGGRRNRLMTWLRRSFFDRFGRR
jgi:tRNA(adenine34) deaminase